MIILKTLFLFESAATAVMRRVDSTVNLGVEISIYIINIPPFDVTLL